MFGFTILRAHYHFTKRKLTIDNTFGFYFALSLEEIFKKKYCVQKDEACIICRYNKVCTIPRLFWNEIIFREPPMFIMRILNMEEEIERDKHELIVEFSVIGDMLGRLDMIIDVLNELSQITSYSSVKLNGIYVYDYFSSREREKVTDIHNIPKYSGSVLFDLKTGFNEMKIKIFPALVEKELAYSIIEKEGNVKDELLNLLKNSIKNTLEFFGCKDGYCLDYIDGFVDVSKIFAKEVLVGDLNLKKYTKYFPDHVFFEGKFALKGNISAIYPLIALAEILNVGKLTSFGFGRLKLIKLSKDFPTQNTYEYDNYNYTFDPYELNRDFRGF